MVQPHVLRRSSYLDLAHLLLQARTTAQAPPRQADPSVTVAAIVAGTVGPEALDA